MVHHETSTGALNPITEVGKLCSREGATFIVDAISSIGGEPVNVKTDHIDFCIGNTNKYLCSLPVLSFVCCNRELLKHLKGKAPYTLDLAKHAKYAERNETPFTPQIPLYVALEQALIELRKEGLANRILRYRKNAEAFRNTIRLAGLETYLPENVSGHIVTNVLVPRGVHFETIRHKLRMRGYISYPGKGPLMGRVVNVGHIGTLHPQQVSKFAAYLAKMLKEELQ